MPHPTCTEGCRGPAHCVGSEVQALCLDKHFTTRLQHGHFLLFPDKASSHCPGLSEHQSCHSPASASRVPVCTARTG